MIGNQSSGGLAMILSTYESLEEGITELACFHDVKRPGCSWGSGKFVDGRKERSNHVFLTFKAISGKSHIPFLIQPFSYNLNLI